MKPTVIFDFDGVLADSTDCIVDIYNAIGPKYRLRPIRRRDLERRGVRAIFHQKSLARSRVPALLREAKIVMTSRMHLVRPMRGIEPVLADLRMRYHLGILSSNSPANLRLFLRAHGWTRWFRFIAGDCSIFGKHISLKRLLKARRLDARRAVYVGDETRDIQAARRSGIPAVAAAWGFESLTTLRGAGPAHAARTPRELKTALDRHFSAPSDGREP